MFSKDIRVSHGEVVLTVIEANLIYFNFIVTKHKMKIVKIFTTSFMVS
jgi:hypothetical protein